MWLNKLFELQKQSGPDGLKLQTYTADSITLIVKNEYFRNKRRNTLGWEVFV